MPRKSLKSITKSFNKTQLNVFQYVRKKWYYMRMKRIIEVEKFANKNVSKLAAWEVFHLEMLHNKLKSDFMDEAMVFITKTGNGAMVWICAALVMMLIEPTFKDGYIMMIALLMCVMFGNLILKNIVRRNRPFFHKRYKLLIKTPWDFSFPSGHTLSSFAAATVIFLTNPWCGIVAYIYAALIALSRLYLRVHFFTDVGFSVLTGIILGNLAAWAFGTGFFSFLPGV